MCPRVQGERSGAMCADPHRGYFAPPRLFPANTYIAPRISRSVKATRDRRGTCRCSGRKDTVAQRSIEMLIGRLITEERFRTDFLSAPEDTLNDLCALGFDLSRAEIAALLNTDPALWIRAASQIDPRLKKVNLRVHKSR